GRRYRRSTAGAVSNGRRHERRIAARILRGHFEVRSRYGEHGSVQKVQLGLVLLPTDAPAHQRRYLDEGEASKPDRLEGEDSGENLGVFVFAVYADDRG